MADILLCLLLLSKWQLLLWLLAYMTSYMINKGEIKRF
jgi:hypothetical protein